MKLNITLFFLLQMFSLLSKISLDKIAPATTIITFMNKKKKKEKNSKSVING